MATPEDVKTVFEKFDKNGDGKISYDELRDVIRALSPSTTSEELENMINVLDKDGDGNVSLTEFASALLHPQNAGPSASLSVGDLKGAFDLYDLDGDGKISASELHVVLGRLGEKCTMEDCVRMIGKFDADGDGHVDFEEFKKMMTQDR